MQKLLIIISLYCLTLPLYAAGFVCAKASTPVEKIICATPELSALDSSLTQAYNKLINPSLCATYQIPYLKADQATWLKEVRNKCTDANCLNTVYSERIKLINDALTNTLAIKAKDTVTGTYQTQCFSIFGLGGGQLRLKELANRQVQFALDCNRGTPSFNMGILEGVINFKPKGIAKYTAPKNEFGNGDCEMEFDFSNTSKIRLTQHGDAAACGFGNGVVCTGDYQLINTQMPEMSINP